MIYGWAKNFGVTIETVLFDMSYRNILLYSAATPQYDDEKQSEWDASKDANNPDNFKGKIDGDDTEDGDNEDLEETDEVFVRN